MSAQPVPNSQQNHTSVSRALGAPHTGAIIKIFILLSKMITAKSADSLRCNWVITGFMKTVSMRIAFLRFVLLLAI